MDIQKRILKLIDFELFGGIPDNMNSSYSSDHVEMYNVRLPSTPILITLYGILLMITISKTVYQIIKNDP